MQGSVIVCGENWRPNFLDVIWSQWRKSPIDSIIMDSKKNFGNFPKKRIVNRPVQTPVAFSYSRQKKKKKTNNFYFTRPLFAEKNLINDIMLRLLYLLRACTPSSTATSPFPPHGIRCNNYWEYLGKKCAYVYIYFFFLINKSFENRSLNEIPDCKRAHKSLSLDEIKQKERRRK